MVQQVKDPGGATENPGSHKVANQTQRSGKQKVNDPSKGGGSDHHMPMESLHTKEMPGIGSHHRMNAGHNVGDMHGYEKN